MKENDYKEVTRERIIELIEEFCPDTNRKQQSFADMCGISKYSVSQYVNGTPDAFNLTVFTGFVGDGHAVSHADGFDAPFCMIFLY